MMRWLIELMSDRLFAVVVTQLFFAMMIRGELRAASSAEEEFSRATRLAAAGAFEDSVAHWKKAEALFEEAKNFPGQVETEIQLAAAYHALGQIRLATETLMHAQELASLKDQKHLARIKAGLGAIYILTPPPVKDHSLHGKMPEREDVAEATLKKSIKLSRAAKDRHTEALARNNLGNLYSYRKRRDDAVREYKAANDLATADPALAAKACANLARSAVDSGNYDEAKTWAARVVEKASKLPDSHDKAYQLLGAGRTFNAIFLGAPDHDNALRLRAFKAFQKAAATAEAIGDKRALSYALGYEGELYEGEKKYDEALTLTRKAVLLAQAIRSADALYRWEWQVGRLLRAQKNNDAAIAAYRRAVETLESIRHDVALRYGNPSAHSSFRDVAGAMYFQLADLLLLRADSAANAADLDRMLLEARDSAELLKSAELEDYFQDECVNLLKSKITKVETVSATAAIVYIIPLPDRTEMLVSLPSGLRRLKSPTTDAALFRVAHQFRVNLEKRTTYEYLEQAKQLHDWLIKPLEPLLANTKIDTLVFIPDGALRNIPMGALHDGQKYLIEKYAVAVTPSLTLMEPRPFVRENLQLAANGLTEGVQGFAPLAHVRQELSNLKKLFGGTELINKQFVQANVEKEFAQESYSIVHIASHGHFDSDAKKSFVLTFDGKLTLDELEQLLRPSQLRDKPVELLTLSACQTAAGDDRAALGLAGVAIKAGARSAFATLWFVNDESSATLVSDFYTALRNHPEMSKAQALRGAQTKLLADQRYAHPCYWAPYLIIGNWL
jgi:CHAT domain-containing protein